MPGLSPRGGVALQRCAQTLAFIRNRSFVAPDDIGSAAPAVMGHRILIRDRCAETARKLVAQVLCEVKVPVQ